MKHQHNCCLVSMAETCRLLLLLLLLLFGMYPQVFTLKVLLIPLNMNSHVAMFSRMGAALDASGHESVLLLPSNVQTFRDLKSERRMNIRYYRGSGDTPVYERDDISGLLVNMKFAESKKDYFRLHNEMLKLVVEAFNLECYNFLTDGSLHEELSEYGFDLAVVDATGWSCLMNFPSMLGVPYAAFSLPYQAWSYRQPELPSFVPTTSTGFGDHMSFLERLRNTASFLVDRWRFDTANPVDLGAFKPGAARVTMDTIMENSLLWFILEDPVLSLPSPRMPNAVSIGDLMVRPAEALQDKMQQFLDASTDGAVLLSFGSVIDFLPKDVTRKLCDAFGRIPQRVIWKTKLTHPCFDLTSRSIHNIMFAPWVAQNDLLGHPNLRLLITHGGWSSLVEAIYHAKPLIVFPLTSDQPRNAKLVVSRGYGSALDLVHFSEAELAGEIQSVIANQSTHAGLQRGAAILRDKPLTASRRIAFWVDHVVKHGDEHLRSSAFKLNFWQFYMVDVYSSLFLLITASLLTLAFLLTLLLSFICRCFVPSNDAKTKNE